jgi:hypothetical protein
LLEVKFRGKRVRRRRRLYCPLLGAVRPCACAGVSGSKERTAGTDRWIRMSRRTAIVSSDKCMYVHGLNNNVALISCRSAQVGEAQTMLPLFCSIGATVPSSAGDLSPNSSLSSPRPRYAESTCYGLLWLWRWLSLPISGGACSSLLSDAAGTAPVGFDPCVVFTGCVLTRFSCVAKGCLNFWPTCMLNLMENRICGVVLRDEKFISR